MSMTDKTDTEKEMFSSGDSFSGSGEVGDEGVEKDFFESDKSMRELSDGSGVELDKDAAAELEKVMKPGGGRARHPVMAALVIVASLAMLWLMREDVAYFFQRGDPIELGDAPDAVEAGKLKDNTYVRIRTHPDINTWATVSRRGCNVGPKSAPKSFYSFYTVRDTGDRLIVRRSLDWQQRTEEQKRKVIELDVSGRLRLFAKTGDYFVKYREFLAQTAKEKPAMHKQHEIPTKELIAGLGNPNAVVQDTEGRRVHMEPRMEVALYASFEDELEMSVIRGHTFRVRKITFSGGDGPATCRPGGPTRGSRVVLEKDPETLDFGRLADGIIFSSLVAADSGSPEDEVGAARKTLSPGVAEKGEHPRDIHVKVPVSTNVYDFESGVQIPFKEGRLVVGEGGACGGKEGERRTFNMEAAPFAERSAAELYVARFGFPYKLVGENPVAFEFVLKMEHDQGLRMLKRQQRGDPHTVDFRTEWYIAKWNELKLYEDHILIEPVRPNHPLPHKVVKRKADPKTNAADSDEDLDLAKREIAERRVPALDLELVKKRLEGHIKIEPDKIRRIRVTTQRRLPAGSFIVLSGETPEGYWYYPLIALLLIGFILFNLWSIRNYFKYVRPAEKRAVSE